MFDVKVLERQLRVPTHGVGRRRELLARGEARFERDLKRYFAMFAESGRAVAMLMHQRADLARLRAEYEHEGVRITHVEDFDGKEASMKMGRDFLNPDENGVVIRTAISYAGPATKCEPIQMTPSEAKALSHADRALLVPGYMHLAVLAQAQWMEPQVLDDAVQLAAEHGIIGETLADDLVGAFIDQSVITDPKVCASFAEQRRVYRASLASGEGKPDGV